MDALGGARASTRPATPGEGATYADNVAKLLAALRDVEDGPGRGARFRTVAVARWPDGDEVACEGTVEGRIAVAPRGAAGFGYDPVFVPAEGDGRTFAEMAADDKHRLSHRGRAFRALRDKLL